MKRVRPELLVLAVACSLATWLGGQVPMEDQPLTDGLLASFVGGWLPQTTRFVVGLLVFGLLAFLLVRRRALQMPAPRPFLLLCGLVLLLALATALSSYLYLALSAWLTWALMAAACLATVAVAGRKDGPPVVMGALALGCTLTSVKAILQYAAIRATEPTFRVFGDWNNPNALAGVLVIGLICALGLVAGTERLVSLLAGISASLIAFALVLTQSKGGYLAAAVGVAGFGLAALAWGSGKRLLPAVAALACAGALVLGLQATALNAPSGGGPAPMARLSNTSEATEQSAGFRQNLWRGAAQLVREQPLGHGLASYRFLSAKPGLTTQTVMTHQTFLQMATEGGVFALLALLALAVSAIWALLSGIKAMPAQNRIYRATVLGALLALGAHGMVESNLQYFGIGFAAFVLIGLAFQLSASGSGPELIPGGLRQGAAIGGCLLPIGALAYWSMVEIRTGQVLAGPPEARESLPTLAPLSGDAWYQAGRVSQDPGRALHHLRRANELQPSTRNARAVAYALAQLGRPEEAIQTLEDSLDLDPNNLASLEALYELEVRAGRPDEAEETARRLLAVEDTPYFKVRALAELVPLEPIRARLFLAPRADESERVALLVGALDMAQRFADLTLPQVIRMESAGLSYSGIRREEAESVMQQVLASTAGELALTRRRQALRETLSSE